VRARLVGLTFHAIALALTEPTKENIAALSAEVDARRQSGASPMLSVEISRLAEVLLMTGDVGAAAFAEPTMNDRNLREAAIPCASDDRNSRAVSHATQTLTLRVALDGGMNLAPAQVEHGHGHRVRRPVRTKELGQSATVRTA
jgi:hypothetical protein